MGGIWISSWRHCDWAGKLIILAIAAFSFVSWYVIIEKFFTLREIRRRHARIEDDLARGRAPSDRQPSPLLSVFAYARDLLAKGVVSREQASVFLEKFALQELEKVESNLNLLATSTVVCPFLGLLGTVWGLLIAFTNMAATGSSSIKVVSSGIAEALITTVAGLVVAIPAAVFNNHFNEQLKRIATRMDYLLPHIIAVVTERKA